MSYTKVNWDENTPLNANNLDTMDTGIDNNNNDITQIQNGQLFSISSNVGVVETISPDSMLNVFLNYLIIPEGKSLILKRARFVIFNDLRLQIRISAPSPLLWESDSIFDDIFVDENLRTFENGYNNQWNISLKNISGSNVETRARDSFYLLFVIE